MDMRKGSSASSLARRIGKKALLCGRLMPEEKKRQKWSYKRLLRAVMSFRPTRKQLLVVVIVLLVVGASTAGIVWYNDKKAADALAAAKAEQAKIDQQNAAAQICYKKKIQEKASMLGKITYDQLYDGNSCLQQ